MVDTLVRDNLQTVKNITRKEDRNLARKNTFLKLIPYVEESLKYFYIMHIGKGDYDLHSVEYGIHEVNDDQGSKMQVMYESIPVPR